jgi:hypothetical protein
MSKIFIAWATGLSDTFESNYPTTEGGTFEWVRQLNLGTVTQVESDWTIPDDTTEKIAYHIPIGKVDWSDDRIGSANWSQVLKMGGTGDAAIEFDELYIKRVSADGNTIRATITVFTGGTDPMDSNDLYVNPVTGDTSLDNPGGAAIDDHLVILIIATNTSTHGGGNVTSIEQNVLAGTKITAPIDDPIPPGFPHSQVVVIG